MLPAKFLWGSVLLRGELQNYAKNSNFENFQSALYSTSVSMPLRLTAPSMHIQLVIQRISIGKELSPLSGKKRKYQKACLIETDLLHFFFSEKKKKKKKKTSEHLPAKLSFF